MELSRDWVLVGSPILSDGDGYGAKINSGFPFFRSNFKFVVNHVNKTVTVVCTRCIPSGCELYVGYGCGYWLRKKAEEKKRLSQQKNNS